MNGLPDKTFLFADGLDHPEGIAVHVDGSVWAGGEAGQIYRITPDGQNIETVANTGGFILGIAFSPGCKWLAICDSANKCVWQLDLSSNKLSIFSRYPFNIPNYPVFDTGGHLYVSESGAFREIKGKVVKFDKTGEGFVWHEGPFNFANGMVIDANEAYLYVVCSWLPGVERIKINADGSAGDREVYCVMPQSVPDGLAFDIAGNLYVSCYTPNAIYKVAPDRMVTLLVDDWEAHTLSNPTNIAFGGTNLDQLFTTNLGRWHISRIDAGIKGLPLASHKK